MASVRIVLALVSLLHPVAALLIAPSAVGLRGHGKDVGLWEIVPNVRMRESDAQKFEGASVQGQPIDRTIQKLKSRYTEVCMTLQAGIFEFGGLGNIMGIVNAAMDFAFQNGATWVMPVIKPPSHGIGNAFVDMFGMPEACGQRDVPGWTADCPVSLLQIPEDDRDWIGAKGWKCRPSQTLVSGPREAATTVCGCDAFLLLGPTEWHFDYSQTGPAMSAIYWRNRSFPEEVSLPLSTVMHVRLGDVEGGKLRGMKGEKFVDGQKFAMMVSAFISGSNIDGRCLKVLVVTDGEKNDANVEAVTDAWARANVPDIEVSDVNVPADEAFSRMTNADILLGGPSGFPRFAAVLSKPNVKVFVEDTEHSHPIDYLPGATVVPFGAKDSDIQDAVAQNEELMKLVDACNKWLHERTL